MVTVDAYGPTHAARSTPKCTGLEKDDSEATHFFTSTRNRRGASNSSFYVPGNVGLGIYIMNIGQGKGFYSIAFLIKGYSLTGRVAEASSSAGGAQKNQGNGKK